MPNVYEQAVQNLNEGKFEEAITKFNKCIQRGTSLMDSLRKRSQAYFYSSQFQSAVNSYEELISKFGEHEQGYAGKALSLTILGKYQEMQKLYTRALLINEKNWKTYLYKGYSQLRTRKYDDALKTLQQAITKNPLNNPISYIARAEVFCIKNNFQACRKDIKYAMQALEEKQNHKMLYQFQIKYIRESLVYYLQIVDTLNKLEQKNLITKQKRNSYETQLTKQLNKSITLNNPQIFNQFCKKVKNSSTNLTSNTSIPQTEMDMVFQEEQKHRSVCECLYSCILF